MDTTTYVLLTLMALPIVWLIYFALPWYFWALYGVFAEMFGGASNDVINSGCHSELYNRVKGYSVRSVVNGRADAANLEEEQKRYDDLREWIKTVPNLRIRHFYKEWLCFYQSDLNKAKKAMRVIDKIKEVFPKTKCNM